MNILTKLRSYYFKLSTTRKFKRNSVSFFKCFKTRGIPYVKVYRGGKITIGQRFKMNNGYMANVIGRQQKCIFIAKGNLSIGDNVGISSVAIVCHNSIAIGNSVLMGGDTVIYDTDFHSLHYEDRMADPEILTRVKTSPVVIGDKVFIGASSTIMKGVSIGENSIVGACSVVVKSIPPNEIWAGNPAKKIGDIKG